MTVTGKPSAAMMERANIGDSIDATIDRIQSEYREMPGLRLTLNQMRRLWMLDRQTCRTVIEKLVDARFLMPTADGRYVRCDFSGSTRQRRNHQEV
jgi:hypothetical protein